MAKKPVVKKPAAAKATLFDELCAAASTEPNEGETFQDFAIRLGVVLSDLDDEAYGKLSPAAVKWFTAATDAINADKEAPELEGFPADEQGEEEPAAPEQEEAPPEVKKKDVKKSAVKKDEAKPKPEIKSKGKEMAKKAVKKSTKLVVKKDAKPKEKKERAQRTDSVAYKLRVAGVKQPDITFEAACAKAGIKPVEGGHAWNVWYLTKLTMQVVKEVNG